MAAPDSVTLADMTGKWVVATKLCSGFEEFLALQGLPWWKRQFVSIVTLHETTNQYKDEAGITHIDIDLSITGGFKGGAENRIVDGQKHGIETDMLGTIYEKCTWTDLDKIDDPWLKEGWVYSQKENEKGGAGDNGELHMEINATNSKGDFSTHAIWGFTELNGVRYHSRRAISRKGGKEARAIGIYGYTGSGK